MLGDTCIGNLSSNISLSLTCCRFMPDSKCMYALVISSDDECCS